MPTCYGPQDGNVTVVTNQRSHEKIYSRTFVPCGSKIPRSGYFHSCQTNSLEVWIDTLSKRKKEISIIIPWLAAEGYYHKRKWAESVSPSVPPLTSSIVMVLSSIDSRLSSIFSGSNCNCSCHSKCNLFNETNKCSLWHLLLRYWLGLFIFC